MEKNVFPYTSDIQYPNASAIFYTPSYILLVFKQTNAYAGSFIEKDETAGQANVTSNMRKLQIHVIRYTCKFSSVHLLSVEIFFSMILFCGQQMPFSECANEQADLGLRYPFIFAVTFSHGATQMSLNVFVLYNFCDIAYIKQSTFFTTGVQPCNISFFFFFFVKWIIYFLDTTLSWKVFQLTRLRKSWPQGH